MIESTYWDNMKRFTLMTWLFMAMCKLGRCRIGRKNAFAVEHLFKSRWICIHISHAHCLGFDSQKDFMKRWLFSSPWSPAYCALRNHEPCLEFPIAVSVLDNGNFWFSLFYVDFMLSSIIPDIPFQRQLQQRRLRVVSCESEIGPQGKCKSEVMCKSKRQGSRME